MREPEAPDSEVIRMAGAGAMTPLAARLAAGWSRAGRRPRLAVEPSVGSGGGVRAAAEGAVDLGLVARGLDEAERAAGLVLVPVARDAVVLATHPALGARSVTSEDLVALVGGERTSLADGTPITVLLRDRSDTAHAALEASMAGLRAARERAYAGQRFRVLFHDDAMGVALASTPGAIGPFGLGAIQCWGLSLGVLEVDGVLPSRRAVEDGTWRPTRLLGFVVRRDRLERVRELLAYSRSEEARAEMRACGYVPATEDAAP
jgi:phosphate transport system substrate-binding protein